MSLEKQYIYTYIYVYILIFIYFFRGDRMDGLEFFGDKIRFILQAWWTRIKMVPLKSGMANVSWVSGPHPCFRPSVRGPFNPRGKTESGDKFDVIFTNTVNIKWLL